MEHLNDLEFSYNKRHNFTDARGHEDRLKQREHQDDGVRDSALVSVYTLVKNHATLAAFGADC